MLVYKDIQHTSSLSFKIIVPYNKTIIDFHGGKYRVIFIMILPSQGRAISYGVNITLYSPP